MKTDDLIAALARETPPARPGFVLRMVLLGALGALGLAVLTLLMTKGVRPDIGTAWPFAAAKAAFGACFAIAALGALARIARPGGQNSLWVRVLGGVAVVSACVVVIGLAGNPMDRWGFVMNGGSFPWCLVVIPCLALPAAIVLFWTLRQTAPTAFGLTGALAGAAAGALGAIAYAMYCPVDQPVFVAAWYGLAIGVCAGLGALAASFVLRW